MGLLKRYRAQPERGCVRQTIHPPARRGTPAATFWRHGQGLSLRRHTAALNSYTFRPLGAHRGLGLTSYRVYFLNDHGRIVRALDLACDTDEEARAKAQALADSQTVELWDRARQLGRFTPKVD